MNAHHWKNILYTKIATELSQEEDKLKEPKSKIQGPSEVGDEKNYHGENFRKFADHNMMSST
jgi:hypothetical protein